MKLRLVSVAVVIIAAAAATHASLDVAKKIDVERKEMEQWLSKGIIDSADQPLEQSGLKNGIGEEDNYQRSSRKGVYSDFTLPPPLPSLHAHGEASMWVIGMVFLSTIAVIGSSISLFYAIKREKIVHEATKCIKKYD